jgi:glycine betaine/choline ABC-type transport system substrate-binding protein
MDRTKFLALLTLIWLSGCSRPKAITVGSKNFTEQNILGEILAQQIERVVKVPVERKLNLGGTLLAHEATVRGDIDLYPEYTGTALTAVLKQEPSTDPHAVLGRVDQEYRKRWNLEWGKPLGFNNTFAVAIRGDMARSRNIRTLSDAAGRKEGWVFGVGYEFLQRADGLPGLVKTYGLQLREKPVSMDLGLLYRAIEGNRVDMIAANSTDGLLSVMDLAVLEDDKHYFPPYECAVVVRQATLAAYPALQQALSELHGRISEVAMRKLNYEIDGKHRPLRQVVAEFLASLASAR